MSRVPIPVVKLFVVVLLLPMLCAAAISYRHFRAVRADFESAPTTQLSRHPERSGIVTLTEVAFQSRDGVHLAGWYIPSKDRAAIIVTHGTGADRSSMLHEMRILADAGFGVLAFDWPGDGLSGGSVQWSDEERQALAGAVDWLARRPDVDPGKLGGLGFSMGGLVMTQVAARDPRLRAVVLLSAPTDYAELTRWQNRKWSYLSELPADLALRYSGMDVTEQRPIDVVAGIAPRSLLVIGGSSDADVPPSMTKALYDAAHGPKSLWMIPGAMHGDYERFAGPAYAQRLVQFFSLNLHPDLPLAQ